VLAVVMGSHAAALALCGAGTPSQHFANFERLLGESDFFVGDAVTVADLTAFDIFNNFGFNLLPSKKGSFPKLVAFMERIAARPKIAAYMASEKYTGLMPFGSAE
jgi:glutathione S-transferase